MAVCGGRPLVLRPFVCLQLGSPLYGAYRASELPFCPTFPICNVSVVADYISGGYAVGTFTGEAEDMITVHANVDTRFEFALSSPLQAELLQQSDCEVAAQILFDVRECFVAALEVINMYMIIDYIALDADDWNDATVRCSAEHAATVRRFLDATEGL